MVTIFTILSIGACGPVDRDVPGPADPGDLRVQATAENSTVPAGTAAMFMTTVTGGRRPFTFRWDQNGIEPVEIELENATSETLTTPELTATGRYSFRVTVTDADGFVNSDFVAVEVVDPFEVTVTVAHDEVFEGTPVTLAAAVGDDAEGPTFVWRLTNGPESVMVDLTSETEAEITPPPLVVAGAYTFEVVVSDDRGLEVTASAEVTVISAITAGEPELALAGSPVSLSALIETDVENVTVQWEVTQGEGSLDDPASLTPMLTTTGDESVTVRLTLMVPVMDGDPAVVTREVTVISITTLTPQVRIETNFGDFTLELDAELAPGHAENFLRYVDERFYDGLLFHRNACATDPLTGVCEPFVLQGGGYERVDAELELKEPTRAGIPSESDNGLTNSELYSISLALSGNNSATGRTQFFVNLDDNGFLDESGFTVFGRVSGGREVVDALVAMPRVASPVIPGEVSLPEEDVIMESVRRAE